MFEKYFNVTGNEFMLQNKQKLKNSYFFLNFNFSRTIVFLKNDRIKNGCFSCYDLNTKRKMIVF